MAQVSALFARRCRTQTALDTLAKWQRRVQRFPTLGDTLQKLFAPTLEKALTCLDQSSPEFPLRIWLGKPTLGYAHQLKQQ